MMTARRKWHIAFNVAILLGITIAYIVGYSDKENVWLFVIALIVTLPIYIGILIETFMLICERTLK